VQSYRHGFHAGNLADVLKHAVLSAVLDAATAKPAPLVFIDTHAGAGSYRLDDGADARAEHRAGIAALRNLRDQAMPASVARYLALVEAAATPPRYPGSPLLAAALLRGADRLILAEQHAGEWAALEYELGADRRATIHHGDGYALLKAVLPPRERRGVILIDPGYELAVEPRRVIDALHAALTRFRHGVYLVWYPLRGKHDPAAMKRQFRRLDPPKTLSIEIDPAPSAPRGATGCGMLIVNPPFQVLPELAALTAFFGRTLATGGRAEVAWLVPE
jgi:23S rRNA (adenine2030-N6)-methyltransferase